MSNLDNLLQHVDTGELRYAVAPYVRLLIAARLKHEPDFIPVEELERWELSRYPYESYEDWQLMYLAADALGRINTEVISRCGTGGIPPVDTSTPAGRIIDHVAFLVPPFGGGPDHNSFLVETAEQLRDGEIIDWNEFARWELLPAIRDDLDQLAPPQSGPWSRERSPTEWCQIFGMGWDALKSRFSEGIIRNVKITTKAYRVHLEDLPSSCPD